MRGSRRLNKLLLLMAKVESIPLLLTTDTDSSQSSRKARVDSRVASMLVLLLLIYSSTKASTVNPGASMLALQE